MPRPMRARFLRAPGRSASSLSFIAQSSPSPSSLAVHHPHQMPHLGDHAPRLRSVGQLAHAADAVEAEPDQRLALRMLAANCAADLLDLDHFAGLAHLGLPALTLAQSAACSASPVSRRRPCSVDTLMLRRAATERGESWCLSASNVARTMLYGFDEPSDFATTSCMPSVSNTARIGPPAMMPVPGGAARRNAVTAVHVVVQRAAFAQRNADEAALGGLGRLADRLRHLARLAVAEADPALLVADDHERREAEAASALHHLGHTIDVDQLVGEFAVALFAPLAWFTCHVRFPTCARMPYSKLVRT